MYVWQFLMRVVVSQLECESRCLGVGWLNLLSIVFILAGIKDRRMSGEQSPKSCGGERSRDEALAVERYKCW
jgi:hypothetical protein